jgi:GAF domain-containing protein
MDEPFDAARPEPAQVPREAMRRADALAALGRIDFARHDLRGVLGEIAGLARACLAGGGEASVTLIRNRAAYTAAFTGEPALALDETQYETGYGPCLDAAVSGQTLVSRDLAAEGRWPAFARTANEVGILSSLSLPLPPMGAVSGALNVYATKPDAFDDDAVQDGRAFADHAAVAIGNANLYTDAAAQARQMREAMEYRAVIEQAKGILMADRRCTADEAFEILRRVSNETNRKLRDVADMLVTEATRPRRSKQD